MLDNSLGYLEEYQSATDWLSKQITSLQGSHEAIVNDLSPSKECGQTVQQRCDKFETLRKVNY